MTYENAFNLNSPNFSENQTTLTLLVPWFGFLQPLLGVVWPQKNKQNDKQNARCSVRCSCLPILVPSSSKQSGASFDGRQRHVQRKRFVRRSKVKIPIPRLDLTFIYEDRFETWFWCWILFFSLHLVSCFWCRDPEIIIKKADGNVISIICLTFMIYINYITYPHYYATCFNPPNHPFLRIYIYIYIYIDDINSNPNYKLVNSSSRMIWLDPHTWEDYIYLSPHGISWDPWRQVWIQCSRSRWHFGALFQVGDVAPGARDEASLKLWQRSVPWLHFVKIAP